MSETAVRVPKHLKNPELRDKFKPGSVVAIPRALAYRMTAKMGGLVPPVLGRVRSVGDRMVGKHYRFAVDITWIRGTYEMWEEWMLERVDLAAPNQLTRFKDGLPPYLAP